MIQILNSIRLYAFIISWMASISSIIWDNEKNVLIDIGVYSFGAFLILTIPFLKRQSIFIVLILILLASVIFERFPNISEIINGAEFILIFAGLIPTMGLVRAAALKMKSVKLSQSLLSKLPKELMPSGFQVTGHFSGAVINTGVFAMLSASIPKDANESYRRSAAEASLRGMASSACWSPFFVAFAVGQVYLASIHAWLGLVIGIVIGLLYSIASIKFVTPSISFEKLKKSLSCLKPISNHLILTMVSVVSMALIFNLTALSAVILVMPILVIIQCVYKPEIYREIINETLGSMRNNIDDVLIISFAMLIGYFVTKSDGITVDFRNFNVESIPEWSVLVIIPFLMTLVSFIGIHPVISSTILLTIFTSSFFNIEPYLIMQAHLIGWCTGTLCSMASLSVITCSNLFKVPSHKVAFGVNVYVVLGFSLLGGAFLSIINQLIKYF